jgi:hypothetical protein
VDSGDKPGHDAPGYRKASIFDISFRISEDHAILLHSIKRREARRHE